MTHSLFNAFDYDVLVDRAKGKPPVIITRRAKQGETLTTLDDVERKLDDFTVLVTDQAGPLSLAGLLCFSAKFRSGLCLLGYSLLLRTTSLLTSIT